MGKPGAAITASRGEDRGRVEPELRELMGLAAAAAALPPWSRSMRARQSGQYLSRVRGRGMEYDESRPYQPGDDIRQLDWRVTARTGRPHTKLFREERERPVFVAVDYGPSMFFATRGVFKAVQAARLGALLAWRGQLNGDRIGGLVFSPVEHHELPPRRGQAAVVRLLKLLVAEAPVCRTAPAAAGRDGSLLETARRLKRIVKPGSLVFLLSDFAGLDEDTASELGRLSAHNNIALIQVFDPIEAAFPDIAGAGSLSDGRRTLRLAAVSPPQRDAYRNAFDAHCERLERLAAEQRMLLASVDTESDPLTALLRLFNR